MDFIVRKHNRKKAQKKYFTQETEDAILKYNSIDNIEERNRIYQKYIHFPFYKLTQNIIHTFKFYNTDVVRLEHLQHEIIIFLLSKIHLFDQGRSLDRKFIKMLGDNGLEYEEGEFQDFVNFSKKVNRKQLQDFAISKGLEGEYFDKVSKHIIPKAYSYFGTIVKRYCITYSKENYENKINKISMSDIHRDYSNSNVTSPTLNSLINDSNIDKLLNHIEIEDDLTPLPGYKEKDKLSWFMDEFIVHCDNNLGFYFHKVEDKKIADAILELFRKREVLDVFNKKALYLYIREMIDVPTPKITKIAKIMSKIFNEKYLTYLEHGYFQNLTPPSPYIYK